MRKYTNDKYQETYYIHTLKSGLKVIIMPKEPSYTTHVSLLLPFGADVLSYDLNQKKYTLPEGIAHFFEHKIYASPEGDMFSKFVSYGLDANAMTGYESTQYVFSATSKVIEGIDLLLETLDHPYFTDENVSKEREIINEEIHMNNDRHYTKMMRHLRKNLYHNHPIQTDILGTQKTIKPITKADLQRVYEHFYQDHQRLLLISGHVDLKAIKTYLETLDNKRKASHNYPNVHVVFDKETVVKTHEEVYEDVSTTSLIYAIKLPQKQPALQFETYVSAIYMIMYGMLGTSSKYQQEMLDQGLISKDISTYVERLKGARAVLMMTDSEHPNDVIDTIQALFKKPFHEILSQETFERFKKISLANQIELLDQQEQKIQVFAQYLLEDLDFYDVLTMKENMTYEDVKDVYHTLQACHTTTLIIKPNKKDKI